MLKGLGGLSELLVFQGERGVCLCLPWLAQTLAQERPQTTPAIFLGLFSSSFPSSKLFLLELSLLLVPLSPLRPDSLYFLFPFLIGSSGLPPHPAFVSVFAPPDPCVTDADTIGNFSLALVISSYLHFSLVPIVQPFSSPLLLYSSSLWRWVTGRLIKFS